MDFLALIIFVQYYFNLMQIAFYFTLISTLLYSFGHAQQLYNHNGHGYQNKTWMSLVDDGHPIRELNIMGTHQSMAWRNPFPWEVFKAQVQTLSEQLSSGIRALDIRVNHKNNKYQMYDRMMPLGWDMDDVLSTVQSFLNSNPSETVLLHLMQENGPSNCNRLFQQTFVYYRDKYPGLFWTPTTQSPILGLVRKKIVLIQDFSATKIYGLMYASFSVLNHRVFNTNWDQESKWLDVKSFHASANSAGSSFIIFWTGNTGSFPYFVASGKSSSGNGDPRLLTGLTTPGFRRFYPDFPRVACFIGICTIVFQGINILAYNRIVNQGYTFLGIVFADFYGDDLLKKFISSNNGGKYAKCTALLVSQGCSLCSSSGACLSCNTIKNYVYNTLTLTCIAAPGFYLDSSYIPVACNITLPGCQACNSNIDCILCDTYNHYALQNSSCVAASGYYLDYNSTPILCPQVGCEECSDAIICTICSQNLNYIMNSTTGHTCMCDNTANFIQAPMVDICICQASFYMTVNNTCETMPLCPDPNSGCIVCASPPVCTLCDTLNNFQLNGTYCICETDYYFNGSACIACTDTLDACTSCISSSLCLTCISNFTNVKGNCQCIEQYYRFDFDTCLTCLPGCLDCTSTTNCLFCDTASNFTLVNGLCECFVGMYLNATTETCQLCSSMAGCITCNMGGCTGCDPIFGFSLNGTACECSSGYFINSNDICQKCMMQGCLECNDQLTCIQCDPAFYFLNNDICDDICGDGALIYVDCDDGNLINGDGCSSTCQVQKDYTCVGGTIQNPSACSYSGPIFLKITNSIKNPRLNQVYINVTIIPNIASMSQLNFSDVVVPNFQCLNTIITFDESKGQIFFQFDYDTSLNDQELTIDFIPPAEPDFFYMQRARVSFPETTDNNLALKYYDQSTYALIDMENILAKVIVYMFWAATLFSIFFVSKIIVVQMMVVLQVSFCGLVMIEKLQSLLLPFVQLGLSNGYNGFLRDDQALPPRISVLQYNGEFSSNFNGSLLLLLLPFITGLALYILGCAKDDKQWKKKAYVAFKQWGITLFLLMQFQLIVSFGIQFTYTKSGMGMAIGGILIIGFLVIMGLFYFKPLNFGQYKQFFQKTGFCVNFYLIVFVYRTLLASAMIFISDINMCGFVALGIAAVYLIILAIARPYVKNFRPILNSIFIVLIIAAQAVYRMKMNMSEAPFITTYLPLFILSMLVIVLLYNIIFMVLHVMESKKMFAKTPQDQEKQKMLQEEMHQQLISHQRRLLQIQRAIEPLKALRAPNQREMIQMVGLQTNRQILRNLKKQNLRQQSISYELNEGSSQKSDSLDSI